MAHDLATKTNGEAALWLNGQPAWHRLGKVWTEADGEITLDRLLTEAGLDFTVEKRPMFYGATDASVIGTSLVTEGQRYAVVRTDTETQVGTVGEVYEPFQNRSAFGFLFDVTGQGVASVESAGLLASGARAFVSLRLGDDIVLDPAGAADRIRRYVFTTTAHNGKGKLSGGVTPTRIVCANTLRMGMRRASERWDIRHTKGGLDRIQAAAETVRNARSYYAELETVGTDLLHAGMTNTEFHDFVTKVAFPVDPKAPEYVTKRLQEQHTKMIYLFEEAATQENIRGTRWAALNAVTEYQDHFGDVRVPKSLRVPAGTPKSLAEEIARGARVVLGTDDDKKTEIQRKLLTWKR